MLFYIGMFLINIVFIFILIYYVGFGVVGVGLVFNIFNLFGSIVGLWVFKKKLGFLLSDIWFGFILVRLFWIGMFVLLGIISYVLVYWGMFYMFILFLGLYVNVVLGIGFLVFEGIMYFVFYGIELVVVFLVG